MAASIEERNRILRLVESGQVSATEAAQLLEYPGGRDRQVRTILGASAKSYRASARDKLAQQQAEAELQCHIAGRFIENRPEHRLTAGAAIEYERIR